MTRDVSDRQILRKILFLLRHRQEDAAKSRDAFFKEKDMGHFKYWQGKFNAFDIAIGLIERNLPEPKKKNQPGSV
jgi:hypothetical protein